jgi:hypothetical protein
MRVPCIGKNAGTALGESIRLRDSGETNKRGKVGMHALMGAYVYDRELERICEGKRRSMGSHVSGYFGGVILSWWLCGICPRGDILGE